MCASFAMVYNHGMGTIHKIRLHKVCLWEWGGAGVCGWGGRCRCVWMGGGSKGVIGLRGGGGGYPSFHLIDIKVLTVCPWLEPLVQKNGSDSHLSALTERWYRPGGSCSIRK